MGVEQHQMKISAGDISSVVRPTSHSVHSSGVRLTGTEHAGEILPPPSPVCCASLPAFESTNFFISTATKGNG